MDSLAKYTHFIWDWNGTILNDTWLTLEVFNQVIGSLGHEPLELEPYQRIFRHPIIDIYYELGLIDNEQEYHELSHMFHDLYDQKVRQCNLHDGVLKCLDTLSCRDKTQSILSALPQDMLDDVVSHHSLGKYFNAVLGHHSKLADSKIDYGRRWMDKQDLDQADVVIIGDTLHDIEVADALGIDCVILPNGYQHPEAFDSTRARVVDSYESFFRML